MVERLLPTRQAHEDLVAIASSHHHVELVRWLLSKGFDVTYDAFLATGEKLDTESFRTLLDLAPDADLDKKVVSAYTGAIKDFEDVSRIEFKGPDLQQSKSEFLSKQDRFLIEMLEAAYAKQGALWLAAWRLLPEATRYLSQATSLQRLHILFQQEMKDGLKPKADNGTDATKHYSDLSHTFPRLEANPESV